jgi:hypothetical protein
MVFPGYSTNKTDRHDITELLLDIIILAPSMHHLLLAFEKSNLCSRKIHTVIYECAFGMVIIRKLKPVMVNNSNNINKTNNHLSAQNHENRSFFLPSLTVSCNFGISFLQKNNWNQLNNWKISFVCIFCDYLLSLLLKKLILLFIALNKKGDVLYVTELYHFLFQHRMLVMFKVVYQN